MKKAIWSITLALTFLVSLGLISYSWWLFRIDMGNQAAQKGNGQGAAPYYKEAISPFQKAPWLSRILRQDYQGAVFNHVALLYTQGKDDVILETLEQEARQGSPSTETGAYAFWMGNVLLRRTGQSKDPEAMMNSLKEAAAAYRRGLEVEPDDWDLKYNYEMVQSILSQKGRGRGQQEKVKSILRKMRQLKRPAEKELAPEKRG